MSAVMTVRLSRPALARAALDVAALRRGIGDRGDLRAAETARPSTATASPSRSRARGSPGRRRDRHGATVSRERALFRLGQRRRRVVVEAARIFAAAARAPARRMPAAVRNAGRWRRRCARRSDSAPCRARTRVDCRAAHGPACGAVRPTRALDAGARHGVGQRQPLDGAEIGGCDEAHVAVSVSFGGSGKEGVGARAGRRETRRRGVRSMCCFERRNAGDMDQQPVHAGGRRQREPAPG